MPCGSEVAIIAELMTGIDKPARVSFCCRDAAHFQDSTPLAEAVARFDDLPGVFALGPNCGPPAYISDLIGLFRDTAPGKRVIVYPNSGEAYHGETRSWSGASDPA